MTEYLTLADALQITAAFGFHVRDAGLLASALARPSASMVGEDAYPSLDRKAAALLDSMLRNHPLVDGNKRTGWTAMVAFLWVNGFRHDFDTDTGFDLVVGIAEGVVDLDAAEAQIRAHRVPRATTPGR
ncbi:type II toxin-antitoxin system death-on-curing family toxin [Glutamicibacter protophormiae]|uniref:type II toxin-antitoxin system death-on-curing family toxin n=1 Tax=Glutamicibacter protophormiae TaxID=37930 RepID=UPI003A8E1846